MSDRRRIHAGELGAALEQTLTIYGEEVQEALRTATEASMRKLVKKTKATAPKGKRKGQFKKKITADYQTLKRKSSRAVRATWYVKAPDYRLTHLLVHGHETKDGGRTRANPFLQNALDEVLPEYEKNIEEAIKNGR